MYCETCFIFQWLATVYVRGGQLRHAVEEKVKSFFFQTKDGIRDTSVTGVQTCALPISPHHPAWVPVAVDTQLAGDAPAEALGLADAALEVHPGDVRLLSAKAVAPFSPERWADELRPEERRGGPECRSRWLPEH